MVDSIRLGIKEDTSMTNGTDFKNKDDSFLVAATAVSDIDSFFSAEGQSVKIL